MNVTTALACRSCGAPLHDTFVDLGETPLANSYLRPEDLGRPEPTYPLHARVCAGCLLVQIEAVATPETIFTDYAYFSSVSTSWVEHARRFATTAKERFGLGPHSLVLEVASNDGYLLQHFLALGVPVLGVEPAANVAEVAVAAGVPTEVRFFGTECAADLLARGVHADLLVGNNVFAHVPALNDFVAGMAAVLAPEGVVSLELPHLLRLVEGVQFDTIYHEHFSYFSLLAARAALARHGLRVFDVEGLPTHGGSLRVMACPDGAAHATTAAVEAVLDAERAAGLHTVDAYRAFGGRVAATVTALKDFLADARRRGLTVVGYGAAAKGNTLLNTAGVGPGDLAYVVDRSPHKQGLHLPGTHLPVKPPEAVDETRPDVLLLLAWNLLDEIVEEMAHVRRWGCRFAVPVPTLRVLP